MEYLWFWYNDLLKCNFYKILHVTDLQNSTCLVKQWKTIASFSPLSVSLSKCSSCFRAIIKPMSYYTKTPQAQWDDKEISTQKAYIQSGSFAETSQKRLCPLVLCFIQWILPVLLYCVLIAFQKCFEVFRW